MTRVAVVVLDTLRKDAFDNHFEWLPGRRFGNAWSPSHWTVPVHGSLFTGVYPSEHGSLAQSEILNYHDETLAETLQTNGFSTRGFSANPFITPAYSFDRGFESFNGTFDNLPMFDDIFNWRAFHEEYNDEGILRFGRAILSCLRADVDTKRSLEVGLEIKLRELRNHQNEDSGIQDAIAWFEDQDLDEKEFVFFNLMEAHAPYDQIPDAYVKGTAPHELGLQQHFESLEAPPVREAYDAAVSYLSDTYEALYSKLEEEMDYIITVGDHGELLGEHGHYGHEYGLFSELTHVPLVLSGKEVPTTNEESVVSLLDVYATVLDIAGLTPNRRGNSLLTEQSDEQTYLIEGHGLPENRIEKFSEIGYDVEPFNTELRGIVTLDGYEFETATGWESEGDHDSESLREMLTEQVDGLDKAPKATERAEPSEAALERLKANGYA